MLCADQTCRSQEIVRREYGRERAEAERGLIFRCENQYVNIQRDGYEASHANKPWSLLPPTLEVWHSKPAAYIFRCVEIFNNVFFVVSPPVTLLLRRFDYAIIPFELAWWGSTGRRPLVDGEIMEERTDLL